MVSLPRVLWARLRPPPPPSTVWPMNGPSANGLAASARQNRRVPVSFRPSSTFLGHDLRIQPSRHPRRRPPRLLASFLRDLRAAAPRAVPLLPPPDREPVG